MYRAVNIVVFAFLDLNAAFTEHKHILLVASESVYNILVGGLCQNVVFNCWEIGIQILGLKFIQLRYGEIL